MALRLNTANVVRIKGILKWGFLYLTLSIGFFCLFQIALRTIGFYYFSFSNQAESWLGAYGVASSNVQLEWKNFNPIFGFENVEHEIFDIEEVTIELDFWGTLLANKIVLKYASLAGGEIFFYKVSDNDLPGEGLNFLSVRPYLEVILGTDNLSVDLSIYNSSVRHLVAQSRVSLISTFQDKRQKIRVELSYPNSDLEPLTLMIDQLERNYWGPSSSFLIRSHGTLALAKLLPSISRASIKVNEGQWQGNLEEGVGALDISFDGVETSLIGDDLIGNASLNFQGAGGALSASVKDWAVSNKNRTVQFEPIWLEYRPDFKDQNRFSGFDEWLSGLPNEIDIRFYTKFLDLTKFGELVSESFHDSEIISSWIAGLNLQGSLSEISGYLDSESGFGLATGLDIDHINSHKGIPEIENLSARAYVYTNGFRIDIDSSGSNVRFDNIFDDKWHIEELSGELDSWFNNSYFSLVNREILAEFPKFKTAGQFSLSRPAEEHQRSLTLLFETKELNVLDRSKYIPNNIPESLRDWLDGSIRTGYLEQVNFAYHGLTKPATYPNSRRVELKSKYRNLYIKYYEDWPLVENAGGFVHLKGSKTQIELATGRTVGVKDFVADITIDNTNLDLNAEIDFVGEKSDFLSFFLNSPLKEELPFISEDWETDGYISGELGLDLPLNNFSSDAIEMSLRFELSELDMVMPDYNLAFSSIGGTGAFSLPHHLSGSFEGKLFGQNVSIKAKNDHDSLSFLFNGIGSPNLISAVLDLPVEEISKGILNYSARLNFNVLDEMRSKLELTSDLTGFGINLPKPFGKIPSEVRNLGIDLEFLEDTELLSASYGDHVAILMLQNSQILGGAIGFESRGVPSDVSYNQLHITGSLPSFDADRYLSYFQNYNSLETAWMLEDLRLENFAYGDFSINGLTVNGIGSSSSAHFEVSSSNVTGTVDFSSDETIVVDLSELELSIFNFDIVSEELKKEDFSKSIVKNLPNMVVNVENLLLNEEMFGSWNFLLRQENNVIEVYPLAFKIKGVVVDEGFLRWNFDTNQTSFNGGLVIDDLSETLKKWDFQPSIVAESTSVDVDLTWNGTPMDFDLLKIEGQAKFDLTKGRFIEINPAEGGMKLASLLNFSTVFGRISKFDFSDVRGQGIGFEKVNANVDFQQGIVTFLEPMVVSSTSSRMVAGGSINMIDNSLNNDLIVTLPVSESLPWYAAYLAVANPIAGLGLIVGERMLRKPIERFSSGKFQVRGTIEKPEISFKGLWDQDVNIIDSANSEIID